MRSSTKNDNRKKDILIIGKGPALRLEDTLTAENVYSINFAEYNKKFCSNLHDNGVNSYLFVQGKEIIKFRGKDSEIVVTALFLGNNSKGWSVDNMRIGLNGYAYDLSVDYSVIAGDDILHIHNYLMKKNDIV